MTEDNTTQQGRTGRDEHDQSDARAAGVSEDIQVPRGGKLTTPEDRMAALAARGPYLVLWSAATVRTFTVCLPDRTVIWHSRFHTDLAIATEEEAATVGALQAVWIAARAREEWGADTATLRLGVANSGVDRSAVESAAISSGLMLDLFAGAPENPALAHPAERWIDWWTTDLGTLIHNPQGLA
ncbi:MAG: hypothetical protein JWN03_4292 [Nocardia sp.]|uniref:hypothetical protein n=1 Tax=Nocardia sp. TaxID=1821 RepID=UPI00262DDB63|nr:hypothetical protein [Nocardia sp.]MCU1644017.1 hypothetical protein [Nocardia sp.]